MLPPTSIQILLWFLTNIFISRYKRTVFRDKAMAESARTALIRLVEEQMHLTASSRPAMDSSSTASSSASVFSTSEPASDAPPTFQQKMKRLR